VNSLFENVQVGIIKEGAAADLIIVDYQPFTDMTAGNLPWHMVFGFRDGMVLTTIVNGKVLMENRELKTMDEEKITHEAFNSSKDVWKKFRSQF
jgi:cytosine/adenosine deaminase-related metal-dependent hydrolase